MTKEGRKKRRDRRCNEMFVDIIKTHKVTFIKFCVIGGLATVLNYSLFYILFTFLHVNYLVAYALGYISGVFLGFVLNRKFTFQKEAENYTVEILKYFQIYMVTLFIGIAVLRSLVGLGMNVLIGNVFTIGCTLILNYVGVKYFVFSRNYIIKVVDFWIYRYRYLAAYIIIGLSAIIVELFIIYFFQQIVKQALVLTILGFIIGMLTSFILNSRINFKVPSERNARTFRWYVLISVLAFVLNMLLIELIFKRIFFNSYSITRFASASVVFLISYSLHRRYTFTNVKEVGVAVYLSATEDVSRIYEKVSFHPDWIHLDLADSTFADAVSPVDVAKGLEVRRYWPKHMVMTHLMTKYPSRWIKKVAPFSDTILIHPEISEPVDASIKSIKRMGKRAGIVISIGSRIDPMERYFKAADVIMILGIRRPGHSGQHLEEEAIHKLDAIISMKNKYGYSFDIAFDGGIKLTNIDKINARYIVSASTVIESPVPKESIHALKTSSRYYYEGEKDLKGFLQKSIFSVLEKTDCVLSGTIVGSFVEKEGLEGIGDIDIIVIVDRLSKEKFQGIVRSFEQLGSILRIDYDHELVVNTTFGPLKFNRPKTVVFHLMIYDVQGHLDHCRKSPFTCLDWQRSTNFVKSALADIAKVTVLQPNYFFSARRSVKDYLEDLKAESISYREYSFEKGVREVKKSKRMENKDKFEFTYHIMKFCMLNSLKLITQENTGHALPRLLKSYFEYFPENAKQYSSYILRLDSMKDTGNFPEFRHKDKNILSEFLDDFESQFRRYFFKDSSKIYFIRHQRTVLNKVGVFIGQKLDPDIVPPTQKEIRDALSLFKERRFARVYSSPLKRCEKTLDVFKGELVFDSIVADNNLIEMDYGSAEGKDISYLKKRHPEIVKAWAEKKDPRFPGGENSADVRKRMQRFLMTIANGKGFSRGHVLVCTHNVWLRCLVGNFYKIPMYKWHLLSIPHFAPLEIIVPRNGRFYINLTEEQQEIIFKDVR